ASLRGMRGLAEAVDPAMDLPRPCLERGAVDDEARGDIGDALDLDEAVRAQGLAGLHEIDDATAEAQHRRQLHRAVELDAFGLHAARSEMPARDFRIFGRGADAAPALGIVLPYELLGRGDREAAAADAEVERGIDLGILELHQHVVAGDAQMRRAE